MNGFLQFDAGFPRHTSGRKDVIARQAFMTMKATGKTQYVKRDLFGQFWYSHEPALSGHKLVARAMVRKGLVFEASKSLSEEDLRSYERNDCSVRAMHVACNITYIESHRALARVGRPDRYGVFHQDMLGAAKLLGYRLRKLKRHHLTKHKTLTTLARDLPPSGGYIIHTARHYTGCWRGSLDETPDRSRIQMIWRVEKT